MTERIDAAVQVQVDEPPPIHVMEEIALTPVDHEVDALALPLQRLAGIPDFHSPGDEIVLRLAHCHSLRPFERH